MNRKDFNTLSESYEKIFENTLSTFVDDSDFGEMQPTTPNIVAASSPIQPENNPLISSEQDEEKQMTCANLKSIVAHAGKILNIIQTNKEPEAWMNNKISVASNDIIEICNALEFRE